MEDQRLYEHEGSLMGPTIIYRRPQTRPRGAEILVRIALCALSALLVSVAWILGGSASVATKEWTVLIGLAAVAAVSLFAGVSRAENDRLREEFAESEARTLAAIEIMIQGRRAPSPTLAMDFGGAPSAYTTRLDRVGAARADPGQLLTDEFRLFLQGRESRDDELRGGSA
jgi:hypothetical protein